MNQHGIEAGLRRPAILPRGVRIWLAAGFASIIASFLLPAPGLAGDVGFTGDRAGAARLLERFLAPDADYRALTLELKPDLEDYRSAYRQPLADLMAKSYEAMWDEEDTVIAPQEGRTDIRFGVTTTDRLISGHPDLEEFPGGYKAVLDFMQPGVPIARFKFVKPGEITGMSFDGLVYVNRHWVLIPKPWSVLP